MPPQATKRHHAMIAFALALAAAAAPAWAQVGDLQVDATWHFAADAVHPGTTIHAALEFRFPENFHVQSNKPLDEDLIPTLLMVTPPQGISVREVVYPTPVSFTVEGFGEPLDVFEQSFVIGLALDVADNVEPGVYPISGGLQYQACNDKVCLAPTTLELKTELKVVAAGAPITPTGNKMVEGITFSEDPQPTTTSPVSETRPVQPIDSGCDVMAELQGFTVLGTAGGYMGADEFIQFIADAEKGTVKKNLFEDMGPLAIVLVVILGGIALNLTPCVLPLIPINLAIIGAGAQAGSRGRGFALGGAYGMAMAAVYGALGLIVILTASTFGAINSTIWFNVGIAILFVFLALAMFDVIAIDFTKYQSKLDVAGKGKRGTFAVAFGMGAVSALLAGACVAPVVIQVIVYSGDQYAKGTTIALALPFFLGLGMALPWPFAGAGLSLLPKPGMWMVRVKQIMGVFILLFAAYYGYIAWGIWDSARVDRDAVLGAAQDKLEEGWASSICGGLAQAREQNKLVLIDMWATWCKNCLAMDKTTFKDPAVVARLEDYVKIKYQAEQLNESPAREILKHFGGIGLPHYAILRPRRDAASPEAVSSP